MTPHPPGAVAIARELGRFRRLSRQHIHPGYRAIIAKAYELDLPKRFATDLTVLDRIQLLTRRPQQFAWRADTRAARCCASLNQTSDRWIISTQPSGCTRMRCRTGGMAVN